MAKISLPYVAWRSGRPRFVPGPRERDLGFKGRDLRHDDGRWFSLDEARAFGDEIRRQITEQRASGRKLKAPPSPRGRAVRDLWAAYEASDEFRGNAKTGVKGLAKSSQKTYRKWVKPLMAEPVWLAPVSSLDPVVLKAVHRKIMGERGLAMARGAMAVLSSALSWGRLEGWLPKVGGQTVANPATNLDLPTPPVRLRIGTDQEIAALVAAADAIEIGGVRLSAVGDAIMVGLFSGQRKRDVLAFIPGEGSNNRIELVQSKTGARVSIPMAPRLIERIAKGRTRRAKAKYPVTAANVVINEGTGLAYNDNTFADHFQQVRAAAAKACPSVADFTFPDLRDTAVTWYARAGCTVPEIASITGHTLGSIYSILKHYLALDGHLADNAVAKLVDYMEREGMAV